MQNKKKFCVLLDFGKELPKIRRDYKKLLKDDKISMNKLIATIIYIIELCNFRIGTEHCKKNYSTYGLSTLLKKHIKIQSNSLAHIKFIGKKKRK